jgi:hypothetical protein
MESVQMPLSRPSFPCWEGWDKVVWLKKPLRVQNQVTQVPTTCYCKTNITVVGAFLSRHKQMTPIFAHTCCKTRGGEGARGLFVVRLPTAAMVTVTAAMVTASTTTATATVAVVTVTAAEKNNNQLKAAAEKAAAVVLPQYFWPLEWGDERPRLR